MGISYAKCEVGEEEIENLLEEEPNEKESMECFKDCYSGEEDTWGHIWEVGWEDSEKPHPGFGGSQNIYGGYVMQCEKCGMFGHEFTGSLNEEGIYVRTPCGEKIR